MKIALLYPGHPRSYNKTRENHQSFLINPLKQSGHEVVIYSSLWSNEGFREQGWADSDSESLQCLKDDSVVCQVEQPCREEFIHTFETYKWRNYARFSGPETSGDGASMWYKVEKCWNCIDQNVHVVFRMRPDLWFDEPFNLALLDGIRHDERHVYMSYWHNKYPEVTHGIMDHFSFGNVDSMRIYCRTFSSIKSMIINNTNIAHTAEGFLYGQLILNDMNIVRVPVRYSVMRSCGLEKVTL